MVALRPILAPTLHGGCEVKGSWTTLEQRQIVKGVKDVLLALVTTGMTSKELIAIKDLHLEGIGFHCDLTASTSDGDTVAIGVKNDLTVRGQLSGDLLTAIVLKLWKRA
jgi:hypothetical protein